MVAIPTSVVRRVGALALLSGLCLVPSPAASADPGPIDLGGTPIEASTDPSHPTEVKAGLWRTELTVDDANPRVFSYTRTMRFSSVHISVTATPTSSSDSIELSVVGLNNTDCGSERESASSTADFMAIGVDLEVGPKDVADLNSDCLRADTIRFSVGPSSIRDSDQDLPLTVKVVEESPLVDGNAAAETLPEPPDDQPSFTAPAAGDDHGEVEGGQSFDDAPLLESGTWSSSITEGEQRIYRVHLEWGQTLAARLNVDAFSESDLEPFGYSAPRIGLTSYNPMRRDLASSFDEVTTSDNIGDDAVRLNYGQGPVRYLNRYADTNAYLPGDYYVAVVVPAAEDREPETIPFKLAVEAQGEVKGVPDYAEDEPFLVGNGERSTVASGNPAPTPEDPGWLNARHLSGLALGVFGLACLGFGAVLFRRRPA